MSTSLSIQTKIIIFVAAMAIIEIIALISLKKYSENKNIFFFIMGIIMYALICVIIVHTFTFSKMSVVNSLWNGLSLIFILMIGYIVFKDKINSNEIMAIILIMIAIYLISKKHA